MCIITTFEYHSSVQTVDITNSAWLTRRAVSRYCTTRIRVGNFLDLLLINTAVYTSIIDSTKGRLTWVGHSSNFDGRRLTGPRSGNEL